jgi:hypothetical protein
MVDGQRVEAQDAGDPQLVCQAAALACALHPNLWRAVDQTLDRFQPQQCRNFFNNAGYAT